MINTKYPFYYSINFKIMFLLTFLTIVPLVINVFVWQSMTSDAAEIEAIENTHHLLRVSNDIFETAIRDTFGIVSLIAVDSGNGVTETLNDSFDTDVDEYLSQRELKSYITSLSGGARTYYSGVSIIKTDGESLRFGVTPPYESDYLKQYEEQLTSNGTNMLITAPHHFKDADYEGNFRYSDMVLSVVRPVYFAGDYIGLISGNVWCNILLDIFDNAVADETEIIILDRQINEIVFSTDQIENNDFYDNAFIQSALAKTTNSSGDFYMTLDGVDYLCVYLNSDYTDWTTLGLMPRAQLLENFNTTSKRAVMMTIIFTVIAVLAGLIMSTLLTRNVRKLNMAMMAVDENNLEIPVTITSKDEIGYLFKQYTAMIHRIKHLINNVKEEEANKRKYEVQALQSQINPHFLYNTLNSIKFLASMQGIENIQSVTEALSEILHTYMNNATVLLPINKELDLLDKYSLIQSYRYTKNHTLHMDIDPELTECLIPKLLLQPLVENSIVHGFRHKTESGIIWLSIKALNDKNLMVTVKDNGTGFDSTEVEALLNRPASDDHIGIYNVHRRVKMYFGDDYGLKAYMNNDGYSVFELTMPIVTEKEANSYV